MTDNESASAGNTEGANEPNSSVKTSKRAKEQADADRKLKELTQRFAQAGPNPDAATIRTVSEYVASALGMEVDSARELTEDEKSAAQGYLADTATQASNTDTPGTSGTQQAQR